jgi:hypothetical protein
MLNNIEECLYPQRITVLVLLKSDNIRKQKQVVNC